MYTVAQRWVKLGRNVDDLWAENGLMEQSINLTGKKIFGQVSILRARELLGVIERDMAQKKEGRDFLPPHDPSTHKSPPVNYPKRTNHEHNGSPVCGTPSQPRGLETSTVNVLRQGGMLWSNHIWECVQSLTLPPGWKVFDPGFPFSNENHIGNRDRTMTSPRHLVFFCHAEGHWSLCYIDTQGDEICHYNSSQSILMPLDKLQTWLNANKIGSDVKVTEKVSLNEHWLVDLMD
jgi:hypothetical protein